MLNWRHLLTLTSFIGLAPLALAQTLEEAPEIDDSPFIPPGFYDRDAAGPVEAPRTNEPPPSLELRGIYSLSWNTFVNIFDLAEQKGTWVRVGDPGAATPVTNLDVTGKTATVMSQGRPLTLSLKDPSDTPLPVRTAATAASPASNPRAAAGQNRRAQIVAPGSNRRDQQRATRPVVRRRVVVPTRTPNNRPAATTGARVVDTTVRGNTRSDRSPNNPTSNLPHTGQPPTHEDMQRMVDDMTGGPRNPRLNPTNQNP